MSLEVGTRIQDLVATNPVGATDFVSQGDDHIRLLKVCIQGSFPSLGANAVTASADELNILDGATLSTAELNYVDGVTSSIQDQIDDITTSVPLLFQPLDSDLTAIAALTTTSFGRGFLDLADLAALATKINALVPTWSGAHTFNGAATFNAATNINAVAGANAIGLTLDVASATSENLVAWKLNAVAKAYTGLIGTATHLVNSSAQNDYAIRLESANLLISTDGGTTANVKVSSAGNVTIAAASSGRPLTVSGADSGIRFTNATANVEIKTSGGVGYIGTVNAGSFNLIANNAVGLTLSSAGVVTINDAGTMREAGHRSLSPSGFTAPGTLSAALNGKCAVTGGVGLITAYAGSDGDIITLLIGAAQTLAPGSGNLYWCTGGAFTTGTRTLAIGSVVTLFRYGGDWYTWGNGIS
jgi:hypothetical protein